MIAKKLKSVLAYALILGVGLGIGTIAPQIVAALKPAYSEGDFAAYYPNAATKVVVYGTATCRFCAATRSYLRERNIAFLDVNISESETGRKQFAELQGKYVPMILVGNRQIIGFKKNTLEDALTAAKVIVAN